MIHGEQDYDKDPVAEQSSILEQVPVIDFAELLADANSAAATVAAVVMRCSCSSASRWDSSGCT